MTREEARRYLESIAVYQEPDSNYREALDLAIKSLDWVSSVQPIRPKGKWIPDPYSIEWKSDAKCSNCGRLVAFALGNYVTCPYCSADMR